MRPLRAQWPTWLRLREVRDEGAILQKSTATNPTPAHDEERHSALLLAEAPATRCRLPFMNTKQLIDTRLKLRSFSNQHGLEWVLAEVDEAVSLGVVEVKALRQATHQGKTVYEEASPDVAPTRGRKRAEEFLSRRPMSALEQVEAIVAALRRVLVDLDDVARTSVDQLRDLPSIGDEGVAPLISEIDFEPDEGSSTPPVTTEAIRHQRRELTTELLDELEREIHS